MSDTAKLRELAEKASNGPWCFSPWYIEEANPAVLHSDGWIVANTSSDTDAAYIAAANPSAVLELLNENTRLRAQVERMREALKPFVEYTPEESKGIPDDYWCRAISFKAGSYRAARAAMEG